MLTRLGYCDEPKRPIHWYFENKGIKMTAWLRCRLDTGMFSDEAAVTYPADGANWQKSVFVPSTFVRKESDHSGRVKVEVLVKDGAQYAVLPSSQRDIVKVNAAADLQQ
jgi:hypothetical protein